MWGGGVHYQSSASATKVPAGHTRSIHQPMRRRPVRFFTFHASTGPQSRCFETLAESVLDFRPCFIGTIYMSLALRAGPHDPVAQPRPRLLCALSERGRAPAQGEIRLGPDGPCTCEEMGGGVRRCPMWSGEKEMFTMMGGLAVLLLCIATLWWV